MRFEIEERNNPKADPNRRVIHVDCELPSCYCHSARLWNSDASEMRPEHAALIRRILAVPGVAELSSARHELRVTKGHVFTWDEVLNPILMILHDHAGEDSAPVPPMPTRAVVLERVGADDECS
jgi:hypothetical protein